MTMDVPGVEDEDDDDETEVGLGLGVLSVLEKGFTSAGSTSTKTSCLEVKPPCDRDRAVMDSVSWSPGLNSSSSDLVRYTLSALGPRWWREK